MEMKRILKIFIVFHMMLKIHWNKAGKIWCEDTTETLYKFMKLIFYALKIINPVTKFWVYT
jgi:hypothetical protein